MTEQTKEFKGLGKFLEKKETLVGDKKVPAIQIHYERLDGKDKGKKQYVQYFAGTLDKTAVSILQTAAKENGKLVIVKHKKPESEYYEFTTFEDAVTWVERPVYTKQWNAGGGRQTQKDSVGVKVGAARNQAIALLSTMNVKAKTEDEWLDLVDKLANKIIPRQQAQEDTLRNKTTTLEEIKKTAESNQATTQQSMSLETDDFADVANW